MPTHMSALYTRVATHASAIFLNYNYIRIWYFGLSNSSQCAIKKRKLTRPVKINHVGLKNRRFCCLSSIITYVTIIYTNGRKSFLLMQKLMGFFCNLQKQCTIATKDISKNITQCNLRSHCWLSQDHSQTTQNITHLSVYPIHPWMPA